MRIRAFSWAATGALALALGAAAAGAACTGSKGQLMVVFQTDMSLPKDIDAIRVLVTLEGAVKYDQTFERLGDEDSIRLPATLGFLTPDDPTQALQIRVIATRGGDEGVRVLRDVVTTVPEGRTATLQIPIQFLCDGSGEPKRDTQGNVVMESGKVVVNNTCKDGKTCIAGTCEYPTIDSADLPDYAPEEVFGGGTGSGDGLCFDTVQCFEGAAVVAPSRTTLADGTAGCTLPAAGGVNVALLTQGGGICGLTACYVPLDGESKSGFREQQGVVVLPPVVCDQVESGKLLGVATAPAGEGACRQKRVDLPTCGPWSASGADQYEPPDGAQPIPLVVGQTHPISLAVAPSGVYWIAGSTFGAEGAPLSDGEVRTVPLLGGDPAVIAGAQPSPRGLAVDDARQLVFWTNAGAGLPGTKDGAVVAAPLGIGFPVQPIALFDQLQQPEGIARSGDDLYWTQLWGDEVFQGVTSGAGAGVARVDDPTSLTPGGPLGGSPYRVAAAPDIVCWAYQGSLTEDNGAIACQRPGAAAEVIAPSQPTPRAIALDVDAGGSTTAVYWASFQGGAVFRFDLAGSGGLTRIAADQALPSGLAVDEAWVYWTNRGDGTVVRVAKGQEDGAPEVLAKDQLRPGAIAVDEAAVYWINEGSPDLPDGSPARDGAILKLAK